jgi:hypothetical protein
MSTVASSEPRIRSIRVTSNEIIAHLVDGRVISVPLAWSWRLSEASPAQRSRHRLIGGGQGVHWPDVDEDISVEGMLGGTQARHLRSNTQPARQASQRASNPRMQPARRRAARG